MHGNPNVGKSTIFNSLTGMHQHTGNWPGKTVANAVGTCTYHNKELLLVDIPGTYSLMSNSEEEEIARVVPIIEAVKARFDVPVSIDTYKGNVVVDGTCLERNLNLVYQIMEITPKIVVCVNLMDEAKKKGIKIDLEEMEKILGVPVVGTIARKKKTLNNLLNKTVEVCKSKKIFPKKIKYLPIIERCIEVLKPEVEKILPDDKKYLSRWICLKLIDGEEKIINEINKNLNIELDNQPELNNALQSVKEILEHSGEQIGKVQDKIISSIVFKAENVVQDVVSYDNRDYNYKDRKIDKIITSKKFGIPIMIIFLGIIFWLTIVGANYPSQLLSHLFNWLQEKIIYVFEYLNAPQWMKGILIDGMYRTLTWVIAVMLPPMAIFFPLFTILEDLGYLPRLAFNLDKFFRKAGSSRKTSTYNVHGIWL